MPLGNSNFNLEGTCLGNWLTGLCVLMGSNEAVVKAWPDLRSESSGRYSLIACERLADGFGHAKLKNR
ncbi:hypothetical protein N9B09_00985 [bacterium]|nr:hypothetical protein [bacterium]